jgi:predicted dehydrogenase
MEKFKWCFIGSGSLAKTVAFQLNRSGRHEIVSCYTRNYEKGVAFAEKFGGKAYDNAEKAITADGVDGVYIVTPHNAHYRYAKQSLELGKPVFCEKAFTVTAKETDELIALAKEKDLYLCEAMWTWFSPSANQTKKWIDENKLGKIHSADFTYHIRTIDGKGRHTDPRRAGGALLDITIYPVTYAYRLWGAPQKIESRGVIKDGIDLGEDIVLTYPDFKVNISASIADFKGFEKMSIKGENGEIKATLYHATNGVTYKKSLFKKETFKGNGPKMNSYLDEFDCVANEIREGLKESRMVTLKHTSDVMHILDQIRAQIGLEYNELE